MSLINDSLKRASKSLEQRGPGPGGDIHLKPIDTAHAPNMAYMLYIPIALVIVVAAGSWFLWKAFGPVNTGLQSNEAKPVLSAKVDVPANNVLAVAVNPSSPTSPQNTLAKTEAIAPAPAISANLSQAKVEMPKSVSSSPATVANTSTEKSIPEAKPVVAAAVTAASEFPSLKLQAIYFRMNKPSVMINGQHLYMKDRILGATVVEIERNFVTLEFQGNKTKIGM